MSPSKISYWPYSISHIFINDLSCHISSNCDIDMYAVESTIHYSNHYNVINYMQHLKEAFFSNISRDEAKQYN